MSARLVKWAQRQHVPDATLKTVLCAVADLATPRGDCTASQASIAEASGLTERCVRNALGILEKLGILFREHRSGGRAGRLSDLICLSAGRLFSITKVAIKAIRQAVPTGTKRLSETEFQPERNAGIQPASRAGNKYNIPSRGVKTLSVSALPAGGFAGSLVPGLADAPRVRSAVWWDKARRLWRTRIQHSDLRMSLGDFPSRIEAHQARQKAVSDTVRVFSGRAA